MSSPTPGRGGPVDDDPGSANRAPGRIDVVIVTYASRETIVACLAGLKTMARLGEIVVVEHGTDGAGECAARLGATAVFDRRNPGFAAGQNAGRRRTSAPFVLILNPDAVIDGPAVDRGAAILDGQAAVAAVQGAIVDPDTGDPERSASRGLGPFHLWGRAIGAGRLRRLRMARCVAARFPGLRDHVERIPGAPIDVEALAATALLTRRAALEEIGGFDETFFLYGEDMDLSRRLRCAGWRLVALPDRWATHRWGSSTPGRWTREVEWWCGAMTYGAIWFGRGQWISSVAAAGVRAVTLIARRPRGAATATSKCLIIPWRVRRSRAAPGPVGAGTGTGSKPPGR